MLVIQQNLSFISFIRIILIDRAYYLKENLISIFPVGVVFLFICQIYLKKVYLLRLMEGRGLLYDFVCRDIMFFGCGKS